VANGAAKRVAGIGQINPGIDASDTSFIMSPMPCIETQCPGKKIFRAGRRFLFRRHGALRHIARVYPIESPSISAGI